MAEDSVAIDAAVGPLVCLIGSSEPEAGRVIERCLGQAAVLVGAGDAEGKVAVAVSWLHRAADAERVALPHHALRLVPSWRSLTAVSVETDVRSRQHVCNDIIIHLMSARALNTRTVS